MTAIDLMVRESGGRRSHELSSIAFFLLFLNVFLPVQHDIAFSMFVSGHTGSAITLLLLALCMVLGPFIIVIVKVVGDRDTYKFRILDAGTLVLALMQIFFSVVVIGNSLLS